MAKRVPKGEQPFRPVSESIVHSVLSQTTESPQSNIQQESEFNLVELNGKSEEVEEVPNNLVDKTPSKPLEKRNREKRFLLSLSEERQLEILAISLSAELGTSVKSSHIIRACLSMLLDNEEKVVSSAEKARGLSRPPNGDLKAVSEFEKAIAKILKKALR